MRLLRWLRNRLRPQPKPPQPEPEPQPDNADEDAELINAHNSMRSDNGLNQLIRNHNLTVAAQNHCQWMHMVNRMQHTGNGGSSVASRARTAGYPSSMVGENIAEGSTSVAGVMHLWQNSSGHRANILRSMYNDIGVAHVGRFWCVVFGARIVTESNDQLDVNPPGAHDG